MDIDYSTPGEVQMSMISYLNDMLNKFLEEIIGTMVSPASDNLVEVRKSTEEIKHQKKRLLHSIKMLQSYSSNAIMQGGTLKYLPFLQHRS